MSDHWVADAMVVWKHFDNGITGPGGLNAMLAENFSLSLRADIAGLVRSNFLIATIGAHGKSAGHGKKTMNLN